MGKLQPHINSIDPATLKFRVPISQDLKLTYTKIQIGQLNQE